jgi:AcrR family transcriptional regulator
MVNSENARIAELLWAPPRRPTRGPKPALSAERIVEAGIALADADGLDAVSMQRVAGEFGFTKMSLYRYFRSKTELVAVMLDTALGPPPAPGRARSRRRQLHDWAISLHDTAAVHPWALQAAAGPRVFGPNELGWLEAGLRPLAGSTLTGAERLDTVVLLIWHVRGVLTQGSSERDLAEAVAGVLAEHGERFPEATAAFRSAGPGQDDALEFGLARILDGLAPYLS